MASTEHPKPEPDARAPEACARKPWHVPVLRQFAAETAETRQAAGLLDGGGGAHRSS